MNKYIISIDNSKIELNIRDANTVSMNGKDISYDILKNESNKIIFKINNRIYEIFYDEINENDFYIYVDGQRIKTTIRTELEEKINALLKKKDAGSKATEIKAPMPGLLLKILKNEGEEINVGEPVAILEAMKMENEIRSHYKGKIAKIFVEEGKSVEKGELILKIN